MSPEPGEVSTRNEKQVKLKGRSEKKRTGIAENKMKDKAGDKKNC
jgi:hypothetical protein